MSMTDMTRQEIFRMGVITQQLGVRDEEELISLIKDGMSAQMRMRFAKRRVNEVLNAMLGEE